MNLPIIFLKDTAMFRMHLSYGKYLEKAVSGTATSGPEYCFHVHGTFPAGSVAFLLGTGRNSREKTTFPVVSDGIRCPEPSTWVVVDRLFSVL